MNNEPKLPAPPTGHVWQYRGMGWTSGGKSTVCYQENGHPPLVKTGQTVGYPDTRYWEAVPAPDTAAVDGFKKGDRVRNRINDKIYTFVEYVSAFNSKVTCEQESVFSTECLELVDTADIPLIEQLRTELDAAKGIAEALEEEVAFLKRAGFEDFNEKNRLNDRLAVAEHGRAVNADLHERAIGERDGAVRVRDEWAAKAKRLEDERDNWEATTEYYRDLLAQCGQAIGREAYTADDGTMQRDVLVAKVPGLVRDLCAQRTTWIRQQINEEDAVFRELSAMPVFKDPHGVFAVPSGKQLEKEMLLESVRFGEAQPDHAQQAKDILQSAFKMGGMFRSKQLDNFVDLIIKAAKQ